MHRDSIQLAGITIRSTSNGLIITSKEFQETLDGRDALELLAFLYDNRDGFFHAARSPELPDWVLPLATEIPALPPARETEDA
jgi:hypothetical protein